MKHPVKNLVLKIYPDGDVTQWFAENPSLYAPLGLNGHNGIDIVRVWGSELYAIEDSIVVQVKNDPNGYGMHVRLLSKEKNANGYYNEWTYGHNSANFVEVGQEVKAGQKIALMGNTGFVVSGSTPFWKSNPYAGTHLHLGLREMRKMTKGGWSYEGSNIMLDAINYNNGYKGAIDPYPILANLSKEETKKRSQLITIKNLALKLKDLTIKKFATK